MQALLGTKIDQSQRFLENGKRIPVTLVDVKDNCVVSVKTNERDRYLAVQLGIGTKKNANRTELGHAKGAKLEKAPKFLREIRIVDNSTLPEVGSILNVTEVFAPGDIVNITGKSKGKGFAGVVKRWGFHGGPKTHGQSDRHRAPGSIGMGTTPGRVFKGKKMAGRMGSENVTIQNLEIIDITDDGVLVIKGLVPGIKKGFLVVNKIDENKNFVPLYNEKVEEEDGANGKTSPSDDAQIGTKETSDSKSSSLSGNQPTESEKKTKSNEGSVSDSPQESSPDVASEKSSKLDEKVEEKPEEGKKEEVAKDAR